MALSLDSKNSIIIDSWSNRFVLWICFDSFLFLPRLNSDCIHRQFAAQQLKDYAKYKIQKEAAANFIECKNLLLSLMGFRVTLQIQSHWNHRDLSIYLSIVICGKGVTRYKTIETFSLLSVCSGHHKETESSFGRHSNDSGARAKSVDSGRWSSNNSGASSGYFKKPEISYVFSEGHSAGVDMAIIAACDSVVISTGSFGWWAAWLANRTTTVYYSNWPRPGSGLAKFFVNQRYFPERWIPMQ